MELSIYDHSNRAIPNARVEKEMTICSLCFSPFTELSWEINSIRSMNAHTSKSVNGLFAVTARMPMPPNARMPAQESEFVMTERVTEVNSTARVKEQMLIVNAHEMPSMVKAMGVGNSDKGCQTGRFRLEGIWASQKNTLIKAKAAPPEATSHV